MAVKNFPKKNMTSSRKGVHSFLFAKPFAGFSAKGLSQKLLGISGIENVSIEETPYGFIVRATSLDQCADLGKEIAESLKNRYNLSLNYYSLRHWQQK